jgi:hypothetical protein
MPGTALKIIEIIINYSVNSIEIITFKKANNLKHLSHK